MLKQLSLTDVHRMPLKKNQTNKKNENWTVSCLLSLGDQTKQMHAAPPCITVMEGGREGGDASEMLVLVLKGWRISNPLPEQA